jgi:hypothetical protein
MGFAPLTRPVAGNINISAFLTARRSDILKRSSLLSVFLLAAIFFAGYRTYLLWQGGAWGLPEPTLKNRPKDIGDPGEESPPLREVDARSVVEKNLFDPERGVVRAPEREVSSAAAERVRAMVLVGTAIMGGSRYAILEDPGSQPSGPNRPAPASLRLKQGDSVEGFTLAEIHEKRVVFSQGTSKIEVVLDYSRKIDDARTKVRAPAQPPRPVLPRILRPPDRGAADRS